MMKIIITLLVCIYCISCISKTKNEFEKLENEIKESVSAFSDQEFHNELEKTDREMADAIKQAKEKVLNEIKTLKANLIEASGGVGEHGIPISKDDQVFGYNYLIEDNNGANGAKLIEDLKAYKSFIMSEAKDPETLNALNQTFKFTNSESEQKFLLNLCEYLPLASLIANLTLMEPEVKKISKLLYQEKILEHKTN